MGGLNNIISKIRGNDDIRLDDGIPNGYLFRFLVNKAGCLIYGFLAFWRFKMCFVHHTSKIRCKKKLRFGNNMNIDRGCYIDALSTDGINFGHNVSVGKYTVIECTGSLNQLGKGFIVGDNVGLGTKGHYGCAGGVVIGSDTIIGNYVSFHSENHNFESLDIQIRKQGVSHQGITIGENCWIGAKATFLDGSVLGNGCVVAAGAVVRGVFPDNCVVGGVPARILKYR